MRLTYRGVSYNLTNTTVKTVETKMTASYRGQTYSVRFPEFVPTKPQFNRVWRGIPYTSGSINTSKLAEPVSRSLNAALN